MNRIERLTAIVLLLQDGPRTSDDIARHFEVSKRTILRDVQALSEMGVPVIAREGFGGGYSLPENYKLAPLPLTTREAFLLMLALSSINSLSDAPFAEERATLMAKLQALVPDEHATGAAALLSSVSLHVPEHDVAQRERAPFLDALVDAIKLRRWVQIDYRSAERDSTQVVFPLRVFVQSGLWYVDAYAHEHEEHRRYRVDRVHQLRVLDDEFGQPPPPTDYDDPAHPQIEATLTARGVALVEHLPTVSAHMRQTDLGGEFSQRVPPSDLPWYARTFLGLGGEIAVHAPSALIELMLSMARAVVERYVGGGIK